MDWGPVNLYHHPVVIGMVCQCLLLVVDQICCQSYVVSVVVGFKAAILRHAECGYGSNSQYPESVVVDLGHLPSGEQFAFENGPFCQLIYLLNMVMKRPRSKPPFCGISGHVQFAEATRWCPSSLAKLVNISPI